jgi:hypothetical protein
VLGNNQRIHLQPGTYQGDIVIHGNDNHVTGAGVGVTILAGRLVVTGNDNKVTNLTVQGPSQVLGNDNWVVGVQFHQGVDIRGNDNKR